MDLCRYTTHDEQINPLKLFLGTRQVLLVEAQSRSALPKVVDTSLIYDLTTGEYKLRMLSVMLQSVPANG